MRNRKRLRSRKLAYAKLEPRNLLTVVANVTTTGSLSVTGFSDGLVEVNALGNQQYQIRDNGVDVATVNGVWQNIVVRVNESPLADSVRINLGNDALFNVQVQLSNGTNDFQITGNAEIMRVIYYGGSGQDSVVTNVDTNRITAIFGGDGENTFVANNDSRRFRYRGGANVDNVTLGSSLIPGGVQAEYASVVLGNGENRFDSFANITTNQFVAGGNNGDRINSFSVGNTAIFKLGHGSNVLQLRGDYARLFVRGGFQDDAVFFDPGSTVSTRVGVILYGGQDFARVDGTISTNFFYSSTDNGDQLFIANSASISGNVWALMGAGSNVFTHNGTINGDLDVASNNVNDNFRVGGVVNGNIRLRPGGQGGGG